METFPSYARIQFRNAGEQPSSVLVRSDMERGVAKQRRVAADAIVRVPLALLFRTSADAASFETWFYTAINAGADWFNWTDPRTGTTREARVVGGEIGTLVPLSNTWAFAERELVIEYIRSAL